LSLLTPNFNPKSLAPKLLIYNGSGTLQYTYETNQVAASGSGTRDFDLSDLVLDVGINDDVGSLVFVIDDRDGVLIDATKKRRPSKLQRQWQVQLWLGKTPLTYRWFYGKIFESEVLRPGTNRQQIVTTCLGWGSILRERTTRMIRNQLKQSNGIDLDDSDTNTRLDNLIKDVIQDTDHYVDGNITPLGNIGVTDVDSNSLDIKVANVNETFNSFAATISKFAGASNTVWGVDADRNLFVRDPFAHDSGFLFTNDLTSTQAKEWNSNKIGYILQGPISWSDTSYDCLYQFLHGVGHFTPKIDVSETTTPNATENIDPEWIAIKTTPTQDNIFKIAVRMNRTGTPATDGEIRILGDDGAGGPDSGDVRRTILIPKSKLTALGTTTPSGWFELPVKPKLEIKPNENIFIAFKKYGDVSNTINVDYVSGSGTYYASSDGSSTSTPWSTRVGKMNYRIYSARRLITTLENTEARRILSEPREKIIPVRSDLEEQTVRQALISAGELLGKERREYGELMVTPTIENIPVGKYCQIKDITTGLNMKVNITGVHLEMHKRSTSQLGAEEIKLTLEDYHY